MGLRAARALAYSNRDGDPQYAMNRDISISKRAIRHLSGGAAEFSC